ncbi:MAG: TolC family protein [Bacteroidaceae bacterium]|nr:TolC family protein [Bacteroidaceae bacterium]
MKYKILSIAIVATLLSSCSLFKNYERPADINTDGIYGDAQSAGEQSLGDIQWREFFTDPQLQALIEKGLTNNPDMKNADLKIQEVQYALKCAKLAYFPNIYFNPSGTISRAWDPYDRNDYTTSKTYSLPATMSWQIGSLGSLRNAKKKAQVNVEQLKNAKQAVQAALVANIASIYYTLSSLDEQLALTQITRENWGKYLDMEKKLMNAGQANLAAVASIEATYYSICTNVVVLEDNIKVLENSLGNILGETAGHISRGALTTFKTPDILSTGAPIRILARRPDVKAAELELASAFYEKNIATSAFYPSLNISATGQFTNSLGGGAINPGIMIGNAVASLSQPIFSNGRIRAQYKISKAEMEVATNNFKQAIIAAGNEVNTAMVELKGAEDQKEFIGKQVTSLEKALDATQKLYAHTSTNYLNVITAQNSLLSAQMSQIKNRMDAINATIDLYQALGGGTE